MDRIEAQLLIPGRGEPVDRGVVIMDDGAITFAGPAADAPAVGDATVTEAATVMPGMWDCHAHLTGSAAMDPLRWAVEPPAAAGARAAVDAVTALRAGFTSIREVGGVGVTWPAP